MDLNYFLFGKLYWWLAMSCSNNSNSIIIYTIKLSFLLVIFKYFFQLILYKKSLKKSVSLFRKLKYYFPYIPVFLFFWMFNYNSWLLHFFIVFVIFIKKMRFLINFRKTGCLLNNIIQSTNNILVFPYESCSW